MTRSNLDALIAWARTLPPMTDAQRRAQAASFAYGNVHLDNPLVTRAMVSEAQARIEAETPDPQPAGVGGGEPQPASGS
ncbi:hypothetical protein DFR50_14229 [Roseiarcus fermentans]|uniref:Uncharacterized protein n=1 Tax=Roseiarcus fermentans TaxID=1473586 RepID=A0A366EN45_9HYPH|nr:hypothetical protein [Roseiarcus fermentans]RBP03781.1 hypothetical protein DFR50_14229 [Roseiarcus fermentans]